MKASLYYGKGYTDLVSVVPPRAELAPGTTLKPAARGKVPGVQRRDGRWVGYAWRDAEVSPSHCATWDKWQSNVGIRADRFPGLDIDVEDESLARAVTAQAIKFFGPAPIRTSREPRRLLVFRSEEPITKQTCTIQYKGREHQLELLGKGQQYLIAGGHPSGTEYGWDGPDLAETSPEDLTVITADQVREFFDLLADKLEGHATVSTGESDNAPALGNTQPIERGGRNGALARIGGALRRQGLGVDAIYAALQEQNRDRCTPPLGDEEVRAIAESVSRYTPDVDLEEATRTAQDEFEADPDAVPPEVAAVTSSGTIELTDHWVTERVVAWAAKTLRFCAETGRWHCWNGAVWDVDRKGAAEHLLRKLLVRLSGEVQAAASRCADEKQQKRYHTFAQALQNRMSLVKLVPELQAHPKIAVTQDEFDKDPFLLATPGGVVNLRTGDLQEANPENLMAKCTATKPDPNMVPERWLSFLEESTDGDEELTHYLQKLAGYILNGSPQEQTLHFIHGPPLTGKSVFINVLSGMLGSYHENAPVETFAESSGDRHPTELAKLAGSRLVTASETQAGRAWNVSRIKSITGNDMISARFMRQDFFDYRPQFVIVVVGNHEPEIRGGDAAMMRRLHIIPFTHSPDEVDRLLTDKLKAEWPGILAWAIEGHALWLEEGLEPPEAVIRRTEEYRREEDPVGLFIEDRCVVEDEDASVSRRDLYLAWAHWCNEQGEEPGTLKQMKRRFAPAQAQYGFRDAMVGPVDNRARGYTGIGLATDEELNAMFDN